MGLNFYEEDYESPTCYACEDKHDTIENVKYWLDAILEHLYTSEICFVDDFERCLEELARSVKMKIPEGTIKFPKPKFDPNNRQFDVNWWKSWNHLELKKLSNS